MIPKGLTLIELVVVLAVLAIASSIMALNVRPFYNPVQDALSRTEGFVKQVRSKAMATTSAYRITLEGNRLKAAYAPTCRSASFTEDRSLQAEIPAEVIVTFTPQGGVPCFNSRGLLILQNAGNYSGEPYYRFTDPQGRQGTLRLFLGGGVVRQ
ncbi:pilus assembly FimT family protein [Thermus sediminis]|uniref:pilus assembly FimT family protein n=1 Tax=Thermus sediminis TaxID=1761908 RepID=UPI000E3D4B24|nr:prepilin-type N-terminal cleavage/methylation domain-containing protein [Thermus sediminis]